MVVDLATLIAHVQNRASFRKVWDSEAWNRNIWLDSHETENLEPLSQCEILLLWEEDCYPVPEETHFPFFEAT